MGLWDTVRYAAKEPWHKCVLSYAWSHKAAGDETSPGRYSIFTIQDSYKFSTLWFVHLGLCYLFTIPTWFWISFSVWTTAGKVNNYSPFYSVGCIRDIITCNEIFECNICKYITFWAFVKTKYWSYKHITFINKQNQIKQSTFKLEYHYYIYKWL